MDDDVFGLRDDGIITLWAPLTTWRGATQALDRGEFFILLGSTVFTAYTDVQYNKKQVRAVSTDEPMAPLSESSREAASGEENAGCNLRPLLWFTMETAMFDD